MSVSMPDPNIGVNPLHDTDDNREAHMFDIDFGPATLLEEKIADPRSPGSAGDETGITAEIIRNQHKR